MKLLKYFSIFFLIAITFFYIHNRANPYVVLYGETMGTFYNIKIKSPREDRLLNRLIQAELERINNEMSVFNPESEISRINSAPAGVWIDISDNLAFVLKTAYQVNKISNGNFDPTIGKLIDLWGFGASGSKPQPTDADIQTVMKYSGFDKLSFSNNFRKVKKTDANTYINLSALAKGYGVDRIAELLESQGYHSFVVEIGGEVRAKGKRSDESKGWNIGIAEPDSNNNLYVITLTNTSVATSGDYRNYFYSEGKRYSHTISPKTGYPVEDTLSSVTVIDKECIKADALSTAIMALGAEKGLEFANANNLSAIMFTRTEEGTFSPIISNKAKKLIETQQVVQPVVEEKHD